MGERRGVYRVVLGKPEGKGHLGEPCVDGRVLRWIFRKLDVGTTKRKTGGWVNIKGADGAVIRSQGKYRNHSGCRRIKVSAKDMEVGY
jgi:hypothetical protein